MNRTIIEVENLGKLYHIAHADTGRSDPDEKRSKFVNRFKTFVQNVRTPAHKENLWALKDINFDVKHGEVIGIIGSNGAGKSTLLKILSRITEPTEGRAILRGRVGSLLEVGTGFHPELTGRENINLSGSILGMKRVEIARKFDEIVAFSEVEKFIDTPVKRYSSGMYVRLAFAVAAHMDPEILIVDEVLAVGDAAFQKKCLGKMGNVAKEGRTVLFVSHNMAAISNLCNRVVCLANGRVINIAETKEGISKYLQLLGGKNDGTATLNLQNRSGNGPLHFSSFRCESALGEPLKHLMSGETIRFVLPYTSTDIIRQEYHVTEVSMVINGSDGNRIANLSSFYFDIDSNRAVPGTGEFVCTIPKLPLRAGRYTVDLYCEVDGHASEWLQSCAFFDVDDGDFYNTGRVTRANNGFVFIDHIWTIGKKQEEIVSLGGSDND